MSRYSEQRLDIQVCPRRDILNAGMKIGDRWKHNVRKTEPSVEVFSSRSDPVY